MTALLHICPSGCVDDRDSDVRRHFLDKDGAFSDLRCFGCDAVMIPLRAYEVRKFVAVMGAVVSNGT